MDKQTPDPAQITAEKEQKRQIILKTLEENGEDWLIAAMVHGSIGYHTPKHAAIIIARFKAGNTKDYCERCDACFNTDLIEMLHYDIQIFERLELSQPGKIEKLMQFTKQVAGFSSETQCSISMLYPTMGI